MVRPPFLDSNGMKKGAWSGEEDNILRAHIEQFGHSNWRLVPFLAGLARCGKSCRLRWVNYLKPGLKRGKITKHEEDLVIKLHKQLGNKWSAIAAELPGRTDNEIKNYWHAHINKHGKQDGVDTKVIKDQMTQECVDDTKVIMPREEQEQSISEINSCMTTDHQEECVENTEKIDALDWIANSYSVADPYQTSFSQLNIDLPPFLEEELTHDLGLYQNDMSTFSDSSDGESTSWNSTAKSQENCWSEPLLKDTFDMVLW